MAAAASHTEHHHHHYHHHQLCPTPSPSLSDRAAPEASSFGVSTPITVVQETVDSLNNRFKPHPDIGTDAVFCVDDDILVPIAVLEFAFSVFKQFPTSLVGFTHFVRMHQRSPTFQACDTSAAARDNQWYYSAECGGYDARTYLGPPRFPLASIALDSACFFHKR